MPTLVLLGEITQVKRILETYNIVVNQDDLLLGKSRDRASANIAAIYREADVTLPTVKADDTAGWELFNFCIAEEYRDRLARTLDEKRMIAEDLKRAYNDVKLHIGIVTGEGEEDVLVSEPTARVGPTIDEIL